MNGIEWVVDAHGCSAESLRSGALLRELFGRIISGLRLRPVGETQWHEFPNAGGITGLCLLAESHLACHTFPDFDAELKQVFGATSVTVRTVTRPYGPPDGITFEPASAAGRISRESRSE